MPPVILLPRLQCLSWPEEVEGTHVGEGQRLCSMTLNRMWWHPLSMSVLFGGIEETWAREEGQTRDCLRAQLQS